MRLNYIINVIIIVNVIKQRFGGTKQQFWLSSTDTCVFILIPDVIIPSNHKLSKQIITIIMFWAFGNDLSLIL